MAIPQAGTEPLPDLAAFLEPFGRLLRRAESRYALERYTTGLLSSVPHKTVSALGEALPGTNGQRLQELLTRTRWEVAEMDRLRIQHMAAHARAGAGALIFDDTGLPKKGHASVGVARQYSGTLGRVDNCQVLVSSHYVDAAFDWPVHARLYLPREWAGDELRRRRTQVPAEMGFATKGEIALSLFDAARAAGLEVAAVVADAGYGDQPSFLEGLEARGQAYAVAVAKSAGFRAAARVEADSGALERPSRRGGRGRPPRPRGLADRVPAASAEALIGAQPPEAWQPIAWRRGCKGALAKGFTAVAVYRSGLRGAHIARRGYLIGERPLPGHQGEAKYYFAWGLDAMALPELAALLHVRWVIERFYQDAKGELGLDDYEGRLWPGLHRHVALVMLAHCYLTLQRTLGPIAERPPPRGERATSASPPGPGGFPPSEAHQPCRPATPCPGSLV